MNLYNVLLNNKIPFVLLESNETENVIYCKSFSDYLFNVGTFVTKTREVILEYVVEDGEKYATADVTFDDGTCFEDVRFKIVINEKIQTPHSTINLSQLQGGKQIEPPQRSAEIIEEVAIESPAVTPLPSPLLPEAPDYTIDVQQALQLEQQLEQEKQELARQRLLVEKQNILNKKLQEYKQELLEEYFHATKKQGEALNFKAQEDFKILEEDLKERIYNTFHEYSAEFETQDKILQTDNYNKLLIKIEESIEYNRQKIDEAVNDKILLESDTNRKKLDEQAQTLEKNYRDKLLIELEKYKTELFEDFKTVSTVELDKIIAETAPDLLERIQQIDDKVKKIVEEKSKFAEKGKFTAEQQKFIVDTAQYWARRMLDLGGGGGSVAAQYAKGGTMDGNLNVNGHILSGGRNISDYFGSGGVTNLGDIPTLSANWNNAYTNLINNSAAYLSGYDLTAIAAASGSWNATYSVVSANSANWQTGYNNAIYNVYGTTNQIVATPAGSNIGNNSVTLSLPSNLIVPNNLTVLGNLTALGTSTFKNTIFTTTSALSVINTGPGPALYVFQAAGPYDVASFYDGDGIEVLHVGNAQPGGRGFIGINESFPGAELTVNGAISSNRTITVLGGNSNQWNSNWTVTNANSANWSAAYTNLVSNSSNYLSGASVSYVNTNFVKLSGDTMTGSLNIAGNLSASGTGYFGHVAANTKSFLIDHPLHAGKKLQYGSLESPYHGVRLTGENVVVKGECKVKLPDYTHALVREEGINIQITNIEHSKTIYVDSVDIKNNEFTVKINTGFFDSKKYKFFWSFSAIRKDIPELVVES